MTILFNPNWMDSYVYQSWPRSNSNWLNANKVYYTDFWNHSWGKLVLAYPETYWVG